ncbi:MAG: penicillin-binding protein activator [Chitinispirillaceae bacterium]|nr:penicillin-binding protein activator [Chitinispirillaceae bacterium]
MMRFLLVAAAAGLMAGTAGQESGPGSEVLDRAVRFYSAGDYDSTVAVIRAFLKENGKDPAAEYLVPLIMEAFLRTGDAAPVHRLYDLYHKKYRTSPFMPRVYYLRGYAFAKEREYLSAFGFFSKALDAGVSDDLDTLIVRSGEFICANELSEGDCRSVCKERKNHARIREIACYYELEKILASDNPGKAKKRMAIFQRSYPDSRFGVKIGDQIPSSSSSGKGAVVGLLAPLSGEEADIGRRVSQGVQLAMDAWNQRGQMQITTAIHDTKGHLVETARKTIHLLEKERASFIIGPLLSSTATVAAALVRREEAVMLTPTATDEGIAQLGSNIFQMNITLGVLSGRVAQYALANLTIKEYAIVAPNSGYGTAMARFFREEVEKNSGSIFDELYYDEGTHDYSALFSELRKKLILRRINQMRGPSAKPVKKVTYADSIRWADSSVSLGAIFMPGEADDIVMLAPQVAFNRIRAQLIGSSGWYSQRTLSVGKQYVHNAIISAPFEPDTSWKKWPEFRREYVKRFREEPDRIAALGYDAATLAAQAMENSGSSLKATRIAEFLAEQRRYEGVSGVISFDPSRHTNTEAVILKLTPNGFVRVQ